jgi:hypothetical protein
MKDKLGQITSSPGPSPSATSTACRSGGARGDRHRRLGFRCTGEGRLELGHLRSLGQPPRSQDLGDGGLLLGADEGPGHGDLLHSQFLLAASSADTRARAGAPTRRSGEPLLPDRSGPGSRAAGTPSQWRPCAAGRRPDGRGVYTGSRSGRPQPRQTAAATSVIENHLPAGDVHRLTHRLLGGSGQDNPSGGVLYVGEVARLPAVSEDDWRLAGEGPGPRSGGWPHRRPRWRGARAVGVEGRMTVVGNS